ncbi:hypothetical protein AB1285_19780 [Microbacterium sp. NRRL B-14842]|uniref:hypothetical protein n=1 Tax=Microbacterium sp. NRRL B-14842 TaxID=3162881 RepID=UPI003D2CA40F
MPGPRGRAPTSSARVAAVEADRCVVGHLHVLEQVESAVLELQRRALRSAESLRDLQQPQPHLLVRTEHVAGGDAEEERVADLSAPRR